MFAMALEHSLIQNATYIMLIYVIFEAVKRVIGTIYVWQLAIVFRK